MRTGSFVLSTKSWGKIDLGELFAFLDLLVEVDLRLFENLDAGRVEVGKDILELAACREFVGQKFVDFVVKDVALLFAGIDKLLQTAEFVFADHAAILQKNPGSQIVQQRQLYLASLPYCLLKCIDLLSECDGRLQVAAPSVRLAGVPAAP